MSRVIADLLVFPFSFVPISGFLCLLSVFHIGV